MWDAKKNWYIKINYHPWIEYRVSDYVNKYASSNRQIELANLGFEFGWGYKFIFFIQYIIPFNIRKSYNDKIVPFGGIGLKYRFG